MSVNHTLFSIITFHVQVPTHLLDSVEQLTEFNKVLRWKLGLLEQSLKAQLVFSFPDLDCKVEGGQNQIRGEQS